MDGASNHSEDNDPAVDSPYVPPQSVLPHTSIRPRRATAVAVVVVVLFAISLLPVRTKTTGRGSRETRITSRGLPAWLTIVESVNHSSGAEGVKSVDVRIVWTHLFTSLTVVMSPVWLMIGYGLWVRFIRWWLRLDSPQTR